MTMANSSKWQLIWAFKYIIKNQEMGHSTKGQGRQMGKTKEKIIYISKKSPRWNPHSIEKEQKTKQKKYQWCPISKRWTPNTWHILKHLALIEISKEIYVMIIEIYIH
jgi:hypothetical protein